MGVILNAISPLLSSCWGFFFAFGHGVYFFGGIQPSVVNGSSALSCNFGVLTGEDECTSFYSSFPHGQSLPSGSFHKPLILLHQRADRMKTTITENESKWSHGPQPCLTQRSYEPCHVGPPKMDRSWWRVLTKCSPLEKRMANHFSILTLRTSWTVWKDKI